MWDGTAYAFSAPHSHVYDVLLAQRRPYQLPVRFSAGESSADVAGTVALNFGEDYAFEGRAGQRVTVELASFSGRAPAIALSYGDGSPLADLGRARIWSGALPRTGAYRVVVFGTDDADATRQSKYAIRLTIH